MADPVHSATAGVEHGAMAITNTIDDAATGHYGMLVALIVVIALILLMILVILLLARGVLFYSVKANESRITGGQWTDRVFEGFIKGNNPSYSGSWINPFAVYHDVILLKQIAEGQQDELATISETAKGHV